MKGFFITATDTGAGKTYVTSLLLKALIEHGISSVGYKPFCCGGQEDAYCLQQAMGGVLDIEEINPFYLRTAASPYVASMFEQKELDIEAALRGAKALGEQFNCVLVEGVGGWRVPLLRDYSVADFAQSLNLPILLVVGNRLGCLNTSLLTLDVMKHQGIQPAGIIVNNLADELDTATITNKGILEDLSGIPVLTDIIFNQEDIDIEPILDLLK